MRKAYKKARWLKAFSRIEKRGGKVFICYKKVKNVEIQKYPFTWEGLLQMFNDFGVDVSKYREGEPNEKSYIFNPIK